MSINQLKDNDNAFFELQPIGLRSSVMKELNVEWLVEMLNIFHTILSVRCS